MTKFVFRLERVLDWRQTELSLEEAKYKRLAARLAALHAHKDGLNAAILEVGRGPDRSRSVSAADLAVSAACRERLVREVAAAEGKIVECGRLLAAQRESMVAARRRVRLLENLKERRRVEWSAAFEKELEEMAAESSQSRWRRELAGSRA
jgi:hypothetical protein